MSRRREIAPRRPPRARPGLESLEARRVPSSLYPPDPCVAIAPAAVAAARADYPPGPIIPRTSAGAVGPVAEFPPQPI